VYRTSSSPAYVTCLKNYTLVKIQEYLMQIIFRSQWPRGLRHMSAAARLLRKGVRIPPGAWMFVYCGYCVLSGWGLCDELVTRPEESYRLWCVVVCDLKTSWMRRPWPAFRRSATGKKIPYSLSAEKFAHSNWNLRQIWCIENVISTSAAKGTLKPLFQMTHVVFISRRCRKMPLI
jgi:hypothetical protein